MHACVDVWGAWYVWHRCRNRGMLVTVRGIIYYMARTVLAWLFIMPPALATGGDHWGGRPWPQGGTISWLICIYIYECIIILNDSGCVTCSSSFCLSISVSCEGSPSVWVSTLLRHVYVLRLIHLDSWTAARLADIKGIQSLWTAQVAKVSLNASYYVGWTFTLRTLTYTVGIVSSSQHGRGLVNWCLRGVPIGTVTVRARCNWPGGTQPSGTSCEGVGDSPVDGYWWILMDIGGRWCQCPKRQVNITSLY